MGLVECPASRRLGRRTSHFRIVTGNYFSTLGVRAYGGRLITPDDDTAASAPAAVLSHRAWEAMYGADPTVVGSTFTIEQHPFTIVGVTPPGFFGDTLNADPPDIWIPIQQEPAMTGGGSFLRVTQLAWLRVIGRLRPAASVTGMLRDWIQHDAGFSPDSMPGIMRNLPRQSIDVIPAGAGITVMKEESGRSLQILFAVCARRSQIPPRLRHDRKRRSTLRLEIHVRSAAQSSQWLAIRPCSGPGVSYAASLRQVDWRRGGSPFAETSAPGGSRNGSTEMCS